MPLRAGLWKAAPEGWAWQQPRRQGLVVLQGAARRCRLRRSQRAALLLAGSLLVLALLLAPPGLPLQPGQADLQRGPLTVWSAPGPPSQAVPLGSGRRRRLLLLALPLLAACCCWVAAPPPPPLHA